MVSSWTQGKFDTYIRSALRAAFRRFPNKYETLKEASVGKRINTKTNRLAEHFRCNQCKGEFPAKEVNVDHLHPVVDTKEGFVNWDVYIKRMFCTKDNLQVLCGKCHDLKTAEERKERSGY